MSPLPPHPASSPWRASVQGPTGRAPEATPPPASKHTNYYCICGYNCTTARALFKHIRRWGPGEPGRHVRAFGPRERLPDIPASGGDERRPAFPRMPTAAGR